MENKFNFEEYRSIGGRIIPRITLGNGGGLNISAGFAKKYDIQNVIGVKLFFDRTNVAIGLKLLTEAEEGMLKIKLAPNQGGAYINARAFLIKFDIETKKLAGRYEPKEIDSPNGKIFVIELKENN